MDVFTLILRVSDESYELLMSPEVFSLCDSDAVRAGKKDAAGRIVVDVPEFLDEEEIHNLCAFLQSGTCAALQNGGPVERKRMQVVARAIGSARLAAMSGLRGEERGGEEGRKRSRPSHRPPSLQ